MCHMFCDSSLKPYRKIGFKVKLKSLLISSLTEMKYFVPGLYIKEH